MADITESRFASQESLATEKSHLQEKSPSFQQSQTSQIDQTRSLFWLDDWWFLDLVGLLGSAAGLISLVVLLKYYDSRPQPLWNYVTLNTVVSWLSTVSKALVMLPVSRDIGQLKWTWFSTKSRSYLDFQNFDAASRGTLGSVQMLFSRNARHLQSIGCLATILAIGISPFLQNMISYYPKAVEVVSQSALVTNSSTYNVLGPSTFNGTYFVDLVLKANVYNSIMNSNVDQPWAVPQFSCVTGNCTFPPLATLSMHSTCRNLTDSITTSCRLTNHSEFAVESGDGSQVLDAQRECKLSLESGLTLAFVDGAGGQAMVMNATWDSDSAGDFPMIQYIMVTGAQHEEALQLQVSVDEEGSWDRLEIHEDTPFVATECTLHMCVDVIEAVVNTTQYSETLLASWCSDGARQPNITGPWQNITTQLGYSENTAAGDQRSGLSLPAGFGFSTLPSMDGLNPVLHSMRTFVSLLFSGEFLAPLNQRYWRAAADPDVEFELNGASYATLDVLQAIYTGDISGCDGGDHLECTMTNFAKAATKTFRDSSYISKGSNDSLAALSSSNGTLGQTWRMVTYVDISWPWVSLPIAIWFMAAVLSIVTAWKTERMKLPWWNNNVLPLLFLERSAIDPEEEIHGLSNLAQIRAAEKRFGQLRFEGWKAHFD